MYYPKSQITTNLYTYGQKYQIEDTGVIYIGFYWKNSKGETFTGKTPQDTNVRKLIDIFSGGISMENPVDVLNIGFYSNADCERSVYEDNNGNYYNNVIPSFYFSSRGIDPNFKKQIPAYSSNPPTQQDYQIGEMRRYFCKKINEIIYIEINKDTYNKLVSRDRNIAYQYYAPFNIPWQLTGDKEQVYKTNKNIVELAIKRQKLPQFDLYLKKDYIKYYQ